MPTTHTFVLSFYVLPMASLIVREREAKDKEWEDKKAAKKAEEKKEKRRREKAGDGSDQVCCGLTQVCGWLYI